MWVCRGGGSKKDGIRGLVSWLCGHQGTAKLDVCARTRGRKAKALRAGLTRTTGAPRMVATATARWNSESSDRSPLIVCQGPKAREER